MTGRRRCGRAARRLGRGVAPGGCRRRRAAATSAGVAPAARRRGRPAAARAGHREPDRQRDRARGRGDRAARPRGRRLGPDRRDRRRAGAARAGRRPGPPRPGWARFPGPRARNRIGDRPRSRWSARRPPRRSAAPGWCSSFRWWVDPGRPRTGASSRRRLGDLLRHIAARSHPHAAEPLPLPSAPAPAKTPPTNSHRADGIAPILQARAQFRKTQEIVQPPAQILRVSKPPQPEAEWGFGRLRGGRGGRVGDEMGVGLHCGR